MTVVVYRSDDASAPALSGTAGSLITVLDAVLVNGYGSKAAAGWAKEFTGTNLAAYRPASGNRFRLRVDDTSVSTARLRGYEVMTGISAGTGLFPNFSQISLDTNLIMVPKGSGATARSWIVIASAKAFYIFSAPSSTDTVFTSYFSGEMRLVFFGDFVSYKQGDQFATALFGSVTTGTSSESFGRIIFTDVIPITGHYVARPHIQLGGSIGVAKVLTLPYFWNFTAVLGGVIYLPVPEPILGEMITVPIDIFELSAGATPLRRGKLPGAYSGPHGPLFSAFDTFIGTGDLAGKTLMCMPVYSYSSPGQFLLDITSTSW